MYVACTICACLGRCVHVCSVHNMRVHVCSMLNMCVHVCSAHIYIHILCVCLDRWVHVWSVHNLRMFGCVGAWMLRAQYKGVWVGGLMYVAYIFTLQHNSLYNIIIMSTHRPYSTIYTGSLDFGLRRLSLAMWSFERFSKLTSKYPNSPAGWPISASQVDPNHT